MATSTIKPSVNKLKWLTYRTGSGSVTVDNSDGKYSEFVVILFYSGYLIPITIPVGMITTSYRTFAVSHAEVGAVSYYGTVRVKKDSSEKFTFNLNGFYDHTGSSVISSIEMNVHGRP